jgi:hypothetical protein
VGRILFLYVIPLALMVYALIDCAQDDDVERTSVPKALWILLIILLVWVGPIAWLVVSKIARPANPGNSRPARRPPGGPRRRGPVAPDDDPDFLRRLDEERRRRDRGGPDAPPAG